MFQYINKIENNREKKFFIEKVNLFVKLINVFAQKNNLIDSSINSGISENTITRLKELKIIESNSEDEQKKLFKVLKARIFEQFIKAINYNFKYKNKIGSLLDKLDPSKRKIIQENTNSKKGPLTVDFFCGAGGLSLGFSQEGFKVDLANDYEDVCIETFRYNHPEVPDERVILGDIRNIVDHIEDYINKDIDVVIGGPPCQGLVQQISKESLTIPEMSFINII